MDNLGDILNSVLSDPETMAKLKETARQLGLDGETAPPPTETAGQTSPTANASDLVSAVGQLAPMLGKLQQDDDMSRLIHALKPFLSGNRLKKAEEADKIMVIMRLIPLLQNYGKNGGQSSQDN